MSQEQFGPDEQDSNDFAREGSLISIIRQITDKKVERLPNGQIPEWSGPQDHEMAEGYTLPTQGIVGGSEASRQPILDTNIISMPPARQRRQPMDLSSTLEKPYQENEFYDPRMCNE